MKKIFYCALIAYTFCSATALAELDEKANTESSNNKTLQERTLSYVCGRINSGSLAAECFEASEGKFLNALALGACDRFRGAQDTIDCVASIAGRNYSDDEVRACDSFSGAPETLRCFQYTGYRVNHNFGNRRQILRMLNRAIDANNNHESHKVNRLLNRIIDLLN